MLRNLAAAFALIVAPAAPALAQSAITVPATGGVAMWFDRADTQILLNQALANPVPQGAPLAFAPPRSTVASGLRRAYVPGNGPFTATAIAMMPLGDWLVALRVSSTVLDAAALDAKLSEVIAALSWPTGVKEAAAAVPVAPCTTPLRFARNAKLKPPEMSDALLGGLLAGAISAEAKDPPAAQCRDGKGEVQFGVYHAVDSSDGYILALGDAGRAIYVDPGLKLTSKEPGYRVTLAQLDRNFIFPSFDKLPQPEAALAAVMKSKPVSSTSRDGKNVTIDPGTK